MKKLTLLDKVKIYFLTKRIESDLKMFPSINAVVTNEWLINNNRPTSYLTLKDGSFIVSVKVFYVQLLKTNRPLDMELYRLYNILTHISEVEDQVVVN